jgi:ribosomal subunit interface protein
MRIGMTNSDAFEVTFRCIHEECDEVFRNSAIDEVKKLSRYYAHIVEGSIIVDKNKPVTRVDITLRVPGSVITGTHEDFNKNAALDGALDKTKTQLKKLKSKVMDHRPPHQVPVIAPEIEPASE